MLPGTGPNLSLFIRQGDNFNFRGFFVKKNISQSAGFEPARGNPNGFQVHRLNHSATTALI